MIHTEYTITGQLKETNGIEKQTYLLHRSFFADSKEQAIKFFCAFFEPELTVMKIFSVVDQYGNII
jgi:hypothetical protein